MISLSADHIAALPVDQLGLLVLKDLIDTNQWNEYNYLLSVSRAYTGEAVEAITEAVAWLRARALIGRTPGNSSDSAISVTRTGRRVIEEGPKFFFANERLQSGLHE